jgi:plastocyanin
MILASTHAHMRVAHARAATLLASTLLLGACSSAPAAAPSPSHIAATAPAPSRPTSPAVKASVTPSTAVATIKANASAPDSGVHDTLVAHNIQYMQTTLAGPADKVWHIDFDQQDDHVLGLLVKHDVTIAAGVSKPTSGLTFEDRLFSSKAYTLGKYTIDVGGLPAGSYTFWCTVHPEMHGVLTIT